jgi:prolyl oligopeptidase
MKALPAVGVMVMLPHHPRRRLAYDYGTAQDSKEMFSYIKGYSPVHNVKAGSSISSNNGHNAITMIE